MGEPIPYQPAPTMRSIQWCALALSAARAAYGYVDTSPFFMFSTSDLLSSANKLSSGEAITSDISSTLSHCPSDHYVLISQPGVSAGDYASCKTPVQHQKQRICIRGSRRGRRLKMGADSRERVRRRGAARRCIQRIHSLV